VAGALDAGAYIDIIKAAGFVDVKLEPVYFEPQVVDEAVAQAGESLDLHDIPIERLQKAVFSAKITARKP
jgi:hypothetical protein